MQPNQPAAAPATKFELKGISLGASSSDAVNTLGKNYKKAPVPDNCLVENKLTALDCRGTDCGTFAGLPIISARVVIADDKVFEMLIVLTNDRKADHVPEIKDALISKYGKPERYSKSYYDQLASLHGPDAAMFKKSYDVNYYNGHYLGEVENFVVENTWRQAGNDDVIVLGANYTIGYILVKITSENALAQKESWHDQCQKDAEQREEQKKNEGTTKRAKDL